VSAPESIAANRADAERTALLCAHPVFGQLDPPQLKRLASYAHSRRVPAGTTVFAKGDPGTALFAVRAGTVKIAVPSVDGREAMFNLLQPGEIFGEIALLDGQARTADAIAMTDCELMVIERRDFLSFVHGDATVALKLIELLCARLRAAGEHLEEVVFLHLPARLAKTLLRLAEADSPGGGKRSLHITQREISHMLGSTRESVNKQLRIWAKRKWIALNRGDIEVLAPKALAAVAAGDEDDEPAVKPRAGKR
jgi:CRP/FNR family cyclic AMP-dependent transcriptional regulator